MLLMPCLYEDLAQVQRLISKLHFEYIFRDLTGENKLGNISKSVGLF